MSSPSVQTYREIPIKRSQHAAVVYHNIFDYPLTLMESIRWKVGSKVHGINCESKILHIKGNYIFVVGRFSLIPKRLLREKEAARKLEIAKKAALIISKVPTIEALGITGSLAMHNTNPESDIDLLVITKKGTLWVSRLITHVLLLFYNQKIRKPFDTNQKDRLCLNIWLESDYLTWKSKNIYTAHELCQVKVLFDRSDISKRFLAKNSWAKDYWPNAFKYAFFQKPLVISDYRKSTFNKILNIVCKAINPFAFIGQYFYMRAKITHETISYSRALFHPTDWSQTILSRLKNT